MILPTNLDKLSSCIICERPHVASRLLVSRRSMRRRCPFILRTHMTIALPLPSGNLCLEHAA